MFKIRVHIDVEKDGYNMQQLVNKWHVCLTYDQLGQT